MNYYVSEVQYDVGVQRTAGTKARNDVEAILNDLGYHKVLIEKKIKKSELRFKSISYHLSCYQEWKQALDKLNLKSGDNLLVQFPAVNHTLFLSSLFRSYIRKGICITVLIHDMEMLRTAARTDVSAIKKMRIHLEEKRVLMTVNKVIVHNCSMAQKLIEMGIDKQKLINLEIFDYLLGNNSSSFKNESATSKSPIIIAGALRRHKVGYVYSLPENVKFNLYGVGYENEPKDHITYFGSFPADDLPYELFGSFGLVWDGESAETCSGAFGEYLRINNPHKTSLYLASGIPVVIWEKAALAEFVTTHKCGITVGSLQELGERFNTINEEEYRKIKEHTLQIAQRLRSGYYTKKAVEQTISSQR